MSKNIIIRTFLFAIRAVMGTLLVKEIFMAEKFNSTIIGSEWFKHKSISPGGYAVDYAFFYTLYRTLSSVKPKNCLEFGLGQTSKMLHQYANYYKANAITIEHDKEWIEFFHKSKEGDYPINVRQFELFFSKYKGYDISTYRNCAETFKDENAHFDFILVDGGPYLRDPRNNKLFKYSRPQIIDIVKYCLQDDFVILFDDYTNVGIKNTVKEIFAYFDVNHIEYLFKEYSGSKTHLLITTPSNQFLTSL